MPYMRVPREYLHVSVNIVFKPKRRFYHPKDNHQQNSTPIGPPSHRTTIHPIYTARKIKRKGEELYVCIKYDMLLQNNNKNIHRQSTLHLLSFRTFLSRGSRLRHPIDFLCPIHGASSGAPVSGTLKLVSWLKLLPFATI